MIDFPLRLKAFDDRKAGKEIFDLGHKHLILVAHSLFPLGQLFSHGQGANHRNQAEHDGGQG